MGVSMDKTQKSYFRQMMNKLERWAIDEPNGLIAIGKLGIIALVIIGLLVIPITYISNRDEKSSFAKCMTDGKGWAVISSEVIPAHMAGKIWIPSKEEPIYGCVEVKR